MAQPRAAPPAPPLRCMDGSCASVASDCPSVMSCPPESPVRCPSGSCTRHRGVLPGPDPLPPPHTRALPLRTVHPVGEPVRHGAHLQARLRAVLGLQLPPRHHLTRGGGWRRCCAPPPWGCQGTECTTRAHEPHGAGAVQATIHSGRQAQRVHPSSRQR